MTPQRFVGIDLGAETIKVVELVRQAQRLRWTRRAIVEHHKDPGSLLRQLLGQWDWQGVESAAVSGRLSRLVNLPRIPAQQAQSKAYRFLYADTSATVVSIGSHGFSVLELRPSGVEVFRENSRCSQGTGNFLRQLVERFNLSIEQASDLCADVEDPAPLSGRCPVILKTDMTHLANQGESQARILAGLYDAVCENVQVLIKPRLSPPNVVLIGGVSRSRRVHAHFMRFLARSGMVLSPMHEGGLFFEALGSALIASERVVSVPALEQLLLDAPEAHLDQVPALRAFLDQVQRMPTPPSPSPNGAVRCLVLGFDIGSTGSKAVALDAQHREVVWEDYVNTNGNPVAAAQTLTRRFVRSPAGRHRVLAVAATGSGREIVGSLLATCYGPSAVYVLNEIAAHAAGALYYDPRVDTIFEIGGQDAKYIRLADGRVVDAAMNEACSAGTGSFIEEQGSKFSGIRDVVHLGQEALQADGGISLGQHCSVFMAEIIDAAAAAGEQQGAIIAGIYDSIIQNYLNRVKGSRSVGQVIFCQGMPFAADALATAVARQTGSQVIIPPHPGSVGALGICLLALKELDLSRQQPLDLRRLLQAQLTKKDTFICRSTRGCGGVGNKCRIDRITTVIAERRQRFSWGGGCALHDQGTGTRKLPDRAPDPFRERQELLLPVTAQVSTRRGRPVVAITDEFLFKGLFPFFATFLHELGFDLEVASGTTQHILKRGIEAANVPFCAPMQLYHGLVSLMSDAKPDYLFLPMLRSLPRVGAEHLARLCPIVQASPDLLRWDLGPETDASVVSPVIDFGPGNLDSREFLDSCQRTAAAFGIADARWRHAYQKARSQQTRFETQCLELGRRALAFCMEHEVVPVIVLGRSYTLHTHILNANVPAILRQQGAIGIPVDCYPVHDQVPVFDDMYWGYGQRILRAAHQIRRTPGHYSIFCSNYACGPDSFTLHFFSYIMQGKPFAIIETDGHSGDAGTKTRVEAFLYCVHEELKRGVMASKPPQALKVIEQAKVCFPEVQQRDELVLIPRIGPGAEALAACFQGIGVRAESLPMPDRDTVRLGRRHTSGKECVPMCITLGSLLQRLQRETNPDERFAFLMPTTSGPCRFGVYNLLHKIILERLGWKERIRVWAPPTRNYFEGLAPGFTALVCTAFATSDMLLEALYDVRPVETRPHAAQEIYQRYHAELLQLLAGRGQSGLSLPAALFQVGSGRLFGCTDLLRRATAEFAAVKGAADKPKVLVVGEIYVRCDPFANDLIIDKLEQRGLRCRFAPFVEWLEYVDYLAVNEGEGNGLTGHLRNACRSRIQETTHQVMAAGLGWPERTRVADALAAAAPYIRKELRGEAVLTLGEATHEWCAGVIDGVVNVSPLECMPSKIAQAQFFHVSEQEGLPALTLSLNGDALDPEIVDNFAFEVHTHYRERHTPPAYRRAW